MEIVRDAVDSDITCRNSIFGGIKTADSTTNVAETVNAAMKLKSNIGE